MQRAQAAMLPDGRRLHLHHGPIDLIVEVFGPGRQAAYCRAAQRFETILQELVDELPVLRQPVASRPGGPTARRMHVATLRFATDFITPMAAVAGAVADDILATLTADPQIRKAYVNNGGDIALHLAPGESFAAILAHTPVTATITANMPTRGIATSGWNGRSDSLGITDGVTVLATTAADADAAATLIGNAVDLPDHPQIIRQPASVRSPDSDLGDRLVTAAVPRLTVTEKATALQNGLIRAQSYLARGLIHAACLTLQGDTRHAAAAALLPAFKEPADA